MLETHLRQASSVLLEAAIRIAPADTRDWGRAMAAELPQVEGTWGAAMWAVGSTGVLAKEAVISLIVPGRRGPGAVPDDGLLAKSPILRKTALAATGACVLAALFFFASPPFRQAFQVAMAPWHRLTQFSSSGAQPDFSNLARRAESRHDAEGIAFCAIRSQDSRGENARLADEAVRLDPHLLWVYAVVALRNPALPEAAAWVDRLKQWDPQNALIYLISARLLKQGRFHEGPPAPEQERDWENAMAAAYQSTEFDDYLDRVAQITQRVVPRYQFYDPSEVESRAQIDIPHYAYEDSERYARMLLAEGEKREAKGDRKGGREQYWAVARFGQLIDYQEHSDFERWVGTALQSMAYQRLQASFQKEGDVSQARLFAYLAAKFDPQQGLNPGVSQGSTFGTTTAARNAAVVEMSGLMILIFAGFAALALAILIAGTRRDAGQVTQRVRPVAIIVVLSSAAGMLFSSVTLYLTYRPYWYIFQSAIQTGDRLPSSDLHFFLNDLSTPSGLSPHILRTLLNALLYSGSPSFLFYVWMGVTLLGVGGLILIVLRRLRGGPRAHAP